MSADCVNLDRVALPGIDVVHDLDVGPWPFEDGAASSIEAKDVFEHVNDSPDTGDGLQQGDQQEAPADLAGASCFWGGHTELMPVLAIIGVVMIVVGILALLSVLHIATNIAIVIAIVGVLLVVVDRAGWGRRPN